MSSEEVYRWDHVAGLFHQARDPILDEIVAENDVDAVTDQEEGQEEGESLDEGSELGEEELDGDGDEVTQRLIGEMFAEEDAKETGEYGCRDEDDSLMEEIEQGDSGEVPEDDRLTTDDDDGLDEL